jgi:hypothetical protein
MFQGHDFEAFFPAATNDYFKTPPETRIYEAKQTNRMCVTSSVAPNNHCNSLIVV